MNSSLQVVVYSNLAAMLLNLLGVLSGRSLSAHVQAVRNNGVVNQCCTQRSVLQPDVAGSSRGCLHFVTVSCLGSAKCGLFNDKTLADKHCETTERGLFRALPNT
jgi:hypothetical protein